jgi:hypothetical protein
MALNTIVKPYAGVGKVYARRYGVAEALREVGNCSNLSVSYEEDAREQTDFTKGGGGVYASIKRINNATCSFTWLDFSPRNLREVLFGGVTVTTGGTVVNEASVAYRGGLSKTVHPNPTVVTVQNQAGTVTYVNNTDYEVRGGGIWITPNSAMTDGQAIRFNYTYAAYDTIEGLIASAPELEMLFEGVNEADSNTFVNLDLWRVKLGPPSDVQFISEEFGQLEIEATLISDPTKTGAGISKFLRVRQAS